MSSSRLPDVSAFAPNEFLSRAAALIGFRDRHYRRMAVEALGLAPGDRVLELGCGTGANFALLERAVGRADRDRPPHLPLIRMCNATEAT